jgi:hypothetical protein
MFGLFGGSSDDSKKQGEPLDKEWDMTDASFGVSESTANDPYSSLDDPFADESSGFDDSTEHFVSAGGGVADVYQDLHEEQPSSFSNNSEPRSTSGGSGDATVDMTSLFGVNSNVMAAVNAQQTGEQDRFLSSKRKGLWETGMHNVGTTYLSGKLAFVHADAVFFVVSRCAEFAPTSP